jgi:photosynthetic reaction center cytochrome c subunit
MTIRMGYTRISDPLSALCIGLTVVLVLSAFTPVFCQPAQMAAGQEAQQSKTAEQEFKNIEVFQGLPASQLIPAMSFMRAALGVQCSYCHVERDFDKDDKPAKAAARRMIKMVREINLSSFNGRNEVTCNTCHRGEPHPVSVPAFAEVSGKGAPSTFPPSSERMPSQQLPSVAQILEKYVQALGGESALRKIQTRVMKGTRTSSDGWNAPVEIYQKAPDKMLVSYRLNASAFTSVFDGTNGWIQTERGLRAMAGPNLARMKQEAQFPPDPRLESVYSNLRVLGKQTLANQEVYLIQGIPTGEKRPERLYFDAQTGLLLRISWRDATPLGPLPDETDFGDYREVDGIKLPFMILHLQADHSYRDVFSEINQNVPIEDDRFQKPSEAPRQ